MKPEQQIQAFKIKSLRLIFSWLCILCIIAGPLSFVRWPLEQPGAVHGISLTFTVSSLALLLLRKHLPLWSMELYSISICYIAGSSSTYFFGLSINSVVMLLLALLIASLRRSTAQLFTIACSYSLMLASIGYLYASHTIEAIVDLNQYSSNVLTWIVTLPVLAILIYISFGAHVQVLEQKAALINKISHQKQQIEKLVNYDRLTGLPALALAEDRLKMALHIAKRKQSKSSLLFLDLDGFKQVNDRFGHAAGDRVLQVVAKRMLAITRATDTCCRIGGDEFLVVIPDHQDSATIDTICQRLVKEIGQEIIFQQQPLQVGVSIGGATYPDHAREAKALRQAADQMMYAVKRTGKNDYRLA